MIISSLKLFLATSSIALFVIACGNDKVRDEATEAAMKAAPAQQAAPANQKPASDQTLAGAINLAISNASASKGKEACVTITAKDFKKIVSMQYTLKWDTKLLKFKELRGFNLPGLNTTNFGTQFAQKDGILTHSWFDMNVKGIDIPDGSKLYEVCFESIGAAGSKATVEFVDGPVIFEITNSDSQFLELKGQAGIVEVK